MMKFKQFDIWIADLEAKRGTESGKVRSVLIVQTDLLDNEHSSTIICPITTKVAEGSELLRVHIKKVISNLKEESDIMIDQVRAIDNRKLLNKAGSLTKDLQRKVMENLKIVLDLD
jgi:mRNA interferase MazF